MLAVVIDKFGGPEQLHLQRVPIPKIQNSDDVLIHLEFAGIGEWDLFERDGGYAQMFGISPTFPYILGSEGSGSVVAIGSSVRRFVVGDRVTAIGFLNPRGGFYSEYVVVPEDLVSPIPRSLTLEKAAVMGGAGLTALRGLSDTLHLRAGESVVIVGASGGVGHGAVQLAKRMGATVLAVASGPDGVALCRRLGADMAIDGRSNLVDEQLAAISRSARLDAALLLAGGPVAEYALDAVRTDGAGRAAYPSGIHPIPARCQGLQVTNYNGNPDREIIERLFRLVDEESDRSFDVHIDKIYPMSTVGQAHEDIKKHHLGKLVLRCLE